MKKNTKKTKQKDQKFGRILGINVLSTTIPSVLARVESLISCSSKFSIVTPNPELILMAQKVPNLKNALNSADLPIPDGVGLYFAYKFLYGKPLNIIPGRRLFLELIKLATNKSWKVFLLGGLDNEADLATRQLVSLYPNILISSSKGPHLDENAEPASEVDRKLQSDVVDRINSFKPQLLFVAFGNPKQEIWIMKNAKKLNAKCIMAVGGTFRYVAGLASLPPKWMESVGLEWFWRLIHEPSRVGRIFNAVVVFPLKVFWSKFEIE